MLNLVKIVLSVTLYYAEFGFEMEVCRHVQHFLVSLQKLCKFYLKKNYLHNIQKLCIPATAATLWLPQWLTRVQNGDREETSPGWFHERKRKKQGM